MDGAGLLAGLQKLLPVAVRSRAATAACYSGAIFEKAIFYPVDETTDPKLRFSSRKAFFRKMAFYNSKTNLRP